MEFVYRKDDPYAGLTHEERDRQYILDTKIGNPNSEKTIRVFTDGSCSNNGKEGATAGIGIHFPDCQIPDIKAPYYGHFISVCPLTGEVEKGGAADNEGPGEVTNQRAELSAIFTAVDAIGRMENYQKDEYFIHLFTDSKYAINSLTDWCYKWKENNWKNSAGKPVKNRDIIEPLLEALKKHRISFYFTKAHTGKTDGKSVGNWHANKLATGGTEMQGKKKKRKKEINLNLV